MELFEKECWDRYKKSPLVLNNPEFEEFLKTCETKFRRSKAKHTQKKKINKCMK